MRLPRQFREGVRLETRMPALHREGEGFDNGLAVRRERVIEDHYSGAGYNDVRFRMCRRAHRVQPHERTPWDRNDRCRMCEIPVVYDRKTTRDDVAKVCVPCAFRLLERGMTELTQLGGYAKDFDADDDALLARMRRTYDDNLNGATAPGLVLPNSGLPRHALRGSEVGPT